MLTGKPFWKPTFNGKDMTATQAKQRFNSYHFSKEQKLKAAKALGKKRREAKWHKEHYDEFDAVKARERSRLKRGMALELPTMSREEALKKARAALAANRVQLNIKTP